MAMNMNIAQIQAMAADLGAPDAWAGGLPGQPSCTIPTGAGAKAACNAYWIRKHVDEAL